jgi:CheY-like chemotaxis protein
MRSQIAKVSDWLFGDDVASGSTEAAQEPFESFGPLSRPMTSPLGEMHRVMESPSRPNLQGPQDIARILIAESDPYHRRVLRVLLASPGMSAIEVEDGQSAIDLLSLRSFDLILLSLELPIMTGMDVVRWVRRSQTPWSDIPILGLVGDAERDGLGRVISMGLTDWTPKPINRQHLAGKLVGLMPNLAGLGL